MPREIVELMSFKDGIICAVDPTDIPNDAESFSIDVDINSKPGELTGRVSDTQKHATYGASAVAGEIIQRATDSTWSFIYYCSDGYIKHMANIYSSFAAPSNVGTQLTASLTPTVVRGNKSLHFGLGYNTDARWVGDIDYGQFGGSAAGITHEASALAPPTTYPLFHKCFAWTHSGTQYVYGTEWGGNYLWRINPTTGAVTKSKKLFVSTQGICDIAGTNYCYVFDNDGANGKGTLYKMLKTDLTIFEQYPFVSVRWETGVRGSEGIYYNGSTLGGEVCDIEETTNYVIFSCYRAATYAEAGNDWEPSTGGFEPDGYPIFVVAKSSLTNQSTFTPFAFNFATVMTGTQGDVFTYTRIANAKRCLFKGGTATEVGWVFSGDWTVGEDYNGGGVSTPANPGLSMLFLTETFIIAATGSSTSEITNVSTTLTPLLKLETTGNPLVTPFMAAYCVYAVNAVYVDTFDNNSTYSVGDANIDVFSSFMVTEDISYFNATGAAYAGQTTWYSATFSGEYHKTSQYLFNTSICYLGTIDTDKEEIAVFAGYTPSNSKWNPIYFSRGNGGKFFRIGWDTGSNAWSSITYVAIDQVGLEMTFIPDPVGTGVFATANNRVYYRFAFRYDLNQDSPMTVRVWDTTITEDYSCKLRVLVNTTGLSKRISSILVYRAESAGASTTIPETYYRLVAELDMVEYWESVTNVWGTQKTQTTTDHGIYGPSYEVNTGIPETLTTNALNYGIATRLGSFHFVADVKNTELERVQQMVVRSKANALNMFDWTKDYVYIPEPITAMAGFNGSLWVFGYANTYRVNPDAMVIEDEYRGVGCVGHRAVCVSDQGMFWADKQSVYHHNGAKIVHIGERIKFGLTPFNSSYGWGSLSDDTVIAKSFPDQKAVLFLSGEPTQVTSRGYIYSLPNQLFRYWNFPDNSGSSTYGLFIGRDGELYLSMNNGIWQLAYHSSGTRKTWTWWSKEFTMGDASQNKMWDHLKITGSTPTSIQVASDGGTSFAALTEHSYYKKLIIKISGGATHIINVVSIIFRRMYGKHDY